MPLNELKFVSVHLNNAGDFTMTDSTTKLIPEVTLNNTVEILKALGHHDRLQIVNILLSGECQVGKIVDELGISQSQTSLQLGKLKMHGVLKSRREANKAYYTLASNNIRLIVEGIVG